MAFTYTTPTGNVSSNSYNSWQQFTPDPQFGAWRKNQGITSQNAPGADEWAKYQQSLGGGAGGAPASGGGGGGALTLTGAMPPATPQTAPQTPLNPQNQSQVAQQVGSTAASLADPFAQERPQYQQQLSNLMRNPGEFASSPQYKFAFDQGMEGVNRTAGAKGLLGSGNRLVDLTKFGQGLAGQQYNQQAQLLGRFAGADTSSPASAGMSYAYGQGKAMDAFNNQEMERAYRDALANQTGGQGQPLGPVPAKSPPTPTAPSPTSGAPYDPAYFNEPGQAQPNYNYSGGFGGEPPISPFAGSPLNLDYQPDSGYGYTSPGAEPLGGPSPGSFYDQYGGNQFGGSQNPALEPGAGGAMDMGVGGPAVPWSYDQPIPQAGGGTLSPIQGQLPPGWTPPQPTFGDWSFMGSRG